MVLQCLGHLYSTSAIGIRLDHTHQFGLRLQEGTVVFEIVDHSIQIDLQNRLMDFLFQLLRDAVKAESTGTLDKDDLIV